MNETDSQVIFTSFHSCVLFRLGRGCASEFRASPAWLACTYPSLWKLERLLRSSSGRLGETELRSDPVASPAFSRANLSARFCWSSLVNSSTGRASIIFSAAVGNNARTVYVQSVWFCSNRRRKLLPWVSDSGPGYAGRAFTCYKLACLLAEE